MRRKPKSNLNGRRWQIFRVDRDALMRSAAAEWIDRCSGLVVCGMAGGMAQAWRAVKRLRADLVVSEIVQLHDFAFNRELHRQHPHLPIPMFSMEDEAVCGAQALEAGASGYLMKEAAGDKLVRSIRAVLRVRAVADHGPAAVVRHGNERMDCPAGAAKRIL